MCIKYTSLLFKLAYTWLNYFHKFWLNFSSSVKCLLMSLTFFSNELFGFFIVGLKGFSCLFVCFLFLCLDTILYQLYVLQISSLGLLLDISCLGGSFVKLMWACLSLFLPVLWLWFIKNPFQYREYIFTSNSIEDLSFSLKFFSFLELIFAYSEERS